MLEKGSFAMKILVITNLYPPHQWGGYELRCKQVVDHLIRRGHEVEVLTSVCDDRKCKLHPNEKNVYRKLHNIHEVQTRYQKAITIISDLRKMDKLIRRFKPDIVYLWHMTSFTKSIIPYLAGIGRQIVWDEGGRGLSYFWNNHGAWHNFLDKRRESIFKRWIKEFIKIGFIAVSGNLLKAEWQWPQKMVGYFNSEMGLQYAQSAGVPIEGFEVIHSGIDINLFPYEGFNDPSARINVLMPGRIEVIKGQKDGVELLAHLIQKNIPVHLTIIGHFYSNEYYQDILHYIKKNHLEAHVSTLPMVGYDVMSNYYRQADICFFSSKQDMGFSRIPLEAMASGCLMITYGNEGSKEVITNNETGFIVSEGDSERIVSIVQEVFENPEKYQKICQAARRMIEQNHSMEIYLDQIESFFEKTVHGK
jgi:glycosyltransferase involved in cell wall biosynthesis